MGKATSHNIELRTSCAEHRDCLKTDFRVSTSTTLEWEVDRIPLPSRHDFNTALVYSWRLKLALVPQCRPTEVGVEGAIEDTYSYRALPRKQVTPTPPALVCADVTDVTNSAVKTPSTSS